MSTKVTRSHKISARTSGKITPGHPAASDRVEDEAKAVTRESVSRSQVKRTAPTGAKANGRSYNAPNQAEMSESDKLTLRASKRTYANRHNRVD